MKTLRFWTIALVLLIVGNAATVFAQSDRGTIRGTVTDPAGAIVPNARVVLNGLETGETRETTTSEDGFYTFPELRPAVYQITVEAQGFQRIIEKLIFQAVKPLRKRFTKTIDS